MSSQVTQPVRGRFYRPRFRPLRPLSRRRILSALRTRAAEGFDWAEWDRQAEAEARFLKDHPFDRHCHCLRCQS